MITKTEEIGIAGGSVSFLLQKAEELSPFQNKAFSIFTPGKAIEEPSGGILLHQDIERHALCA